MAAGADITLKNVTIDAQNLNDNAIEVMGDGAKLTLENVIIKNFKQAGIYIGDSSASVGNESVILKGTITFEAANDAWGGIGVRDGRSLDANQATIIYDNSTVEIYETENDANSNNDKVVEIKPVIWTENGTGNGVNIDTNDYVKYHISKLVNGVRYKDSTNPSQTIFTNK